MDVPIVDVFASSITPDEGNGLDGGVITDSVDCVGGSMHTV